MSPAAKKSETAGRLRLLREAHETLGRYRAVNTRRHVAALLLAVVLVAGCGGAPSPTSTPPPNTPLPTSSSDVATPVAEIGKNPNLTTIQTGQEVAISVVVTDSDPQFSWEASGGEPRPEDGQSIIYRAPEEPGMVTVTVTISGGGGPEITTRSLSFYVLRPMPTAAPPQAPIISEPAEGDVVPMRIAVRGSVSPLGERQSLQVFVRPHGYGYWVQPTPIISADGSWVSEPVGVGVEGDIGMSFDICAMVIGGYLERGDVVHELPEGPVTCIWVTRG
jgi:hypothetical protein